MVGGPGGGVWGTRGEGQQSTLPRPPPQEDGGGTGGRGLHGRARWEGQ